MARRVPVPIYTLSFIPIREKLLPYRAREALRVLERFSAETGGTLFPVHGPHDLDRAVRRIQGELRFQYVIGFYPAGDVWDGSFRVLRLTTKRDSLRVRTRRGYYANP
jgi:VWFA-related protein